MQRFKIVCEYVGTSFSGWQRQSSVAVSGNSATVCGVLEDALMSCGAGQLHGSVVGAGRTDSGVHALGQTAHFDFTPKRATPLDGRTMRDIVNHRIAAPHRAHLRVVRCDPVRSDFHARYDCVKRSYVYRLAVAARADECARGSLFDSPFVWSLQAPLDIDRMHAACQVLSGEHDFAAFRNSGCIARSTIRTLQLSLTVSNSDVFDTLRQHGAIDEVRLKGVQHVSIAAESSSFLYRQVRLLVAALVDVGYGRRSLEELQLSLRTGQQTAVPIKPAPPNGLFFVAAHYRSTDQA
jgi:tRNA pseudouridine38-40 synthase